MDLSICNSCSSKNLKKQKLIICIVFALVLILVMFVSQIQNKRQHKAFLKQIEALEYQNEKQLSELAKQERDIKIYRMEIAKNSYKMNMPREEFLSIMTEYLTKDGRCEVKIEKIDWSSWGNQYN